jgi:UDP-4-amino-4,6-dideoxy-N-acetyl-beta-L-altrosamine N-acetyltransferase
MADAPRSDRVRPVTAADLDMLLEWRNHDDVRRFMCTQHRITPAEHQAWFVRQSSDPCQHPLVFEGDGEPLGFVKLNVIADGQVAEWGFYVSPIAAPGTGRRLGRTALSHAFGILRLHKVSGRALAFNTPSIRFHERMGFVREGVLRQHHFDGVSYHDVIAFGLLCAEWRNASTTGPSPP